jgi:uncharacterized protein YegP (UPF0339 family)
VAGRPFPSFFIYKDTAGEYRWRYQATNGKIIADSGEDYVTKADCRRGLDLMIATNPHTPIWKSGEVE